MTAVCGEGGEELGKGRSAQPGLDVGLGCSAAIGGMEGVEEKLCHHCSAWPWGGRADREGAGQPGCSKVAADSSNEGRMMAVGRERHGSGLLVRGKGVLPPLGAVLLACAVRGKDGAGGGVWKKR